MPRRARLLLFAVLVAFVAAGAGYWRLLYYPRPEPPRLSAPLRGDSVAVNGSTRSYSFHAPARLAEQPALVLLLHGSGGSADQMRQVTGYAFERLADEHGFIAAYPQGYGRHWNDCRSRAPYAAKRLAVDDIGFVRALIARFGESHGVDPARVYVVGYSNGAHLAYRLALEAPETVRAIAAIAANLPADENSDCVPRSGRTSVLIVNGTADPINPYEGGVVSLFGFASRGSVRSAEQTAAYFARRAGAIESNALQPLAADPATGTAVERRQWLSPADGAEIVLYTVRGGGHTLPQPGARFPRILGRTNTVLDGPVEIWRFLQRHGAAASGPGA